jgi:integrase
VDFTQAKLTLNRRKVNDELKVPMAGPLKEELFALWAEKGMPKEGYVFISEAGKPFSATRTLFAFKPVVARLGMAWMTLKVFRKFAATSIYEKTGDVRMVQMLLGHTSVQTTELYLGRGADARLRAVEALEGIMGGKNVGSETGSQNLGTKLGTNR